MDTRRPRIGTLAASALFLAAIGCVAEEPQPVPPPPVPPQELCPEGFGPLGNGVEDGCYRTLEDAEWIAGEDACELHESQGVAAHLVIVDRKVEHLALAQMAPATYSGVWIGRFQIEPDSEFLNVNYVEYGPEHFGVGEPNDFGNECSLLFCDGRPGIGDERCIEYHPDTGMWNDKACHRAGAVVCEWDGVAPLGWRPGDD